MPCGKHAACNPLATWRISDECATMMASTVHDTGGRCTTVHALAIAQSLRRSCVWARPTTCSAHPWPVAVANSIHPHIMRCDDTNTAHRNMLQRCRCQSNHAAVNMHLTRCRVWHHTTTIPIHLSEAVPALAPCDDGAATKSIVPCPSCHIGSEATVCGACRHGACLCGAHAFAFRTWDCRRCVLVSLGCTVPRASSVVCASVAAQQGSVWRMAVYCVVRESTHIAVYIAA